MPWSLADARHLSLFVARHAGQALAWAEEHTGVPAIVVAAALLVAGYKLLKRTARFALEVALVVGLLGLASALGWVRF
ncbi:MAG: hypothetical protein IPQ09_04550 [Myxococcales bacterium]|nr:hypothetical protein [Myxococcales bacterium]HQY65038.1 hypothetical protein [Polyangiaceae bacterium]